MDIKNYRGVKGLRYEFKGHEYALCDEESSGETPEEYSKSTDGGWCALPVVDIASNPVENSIYPSVHLCFDWDEKKERMRPVDLEDWGFMYDIDRELIMHKDDAGNLVVL